MGWARLQAHEVRVAVHHLPQHTLLAPVHVQLLRCHVRKDHLKPPSRESASQRHASYSRPSRSFLGLLYPPQRPQERKREEESIQVHADMHACSSTTPLHRHAVWRTEPQAGLHK